MRQKVYGRSSINEWDSKQLSRAFVKDKKNVIEKFLMVRGQVQLLPLIIILALLILPLLEILIVNVSLGAYYIPDKPIFIKQKISTLQYLINQFSVEREFGNIKVNVTVQDNFGKIVGSKIYSLSTGYFTLNTNVVLSKGYNVTMTIDSPFRYDSGSMTIG